MINNDIFVQIGTNNGNDEFRDLVKKLKPSKIILIEPCKYLNEQIKNNYMGIENYHIENYAITNEENRGIVKLCYPKTQENGKSVNGFTYSDGGYSLIPMDDWGDDFTVYECESMTFMEMCQKYDITKITYLQIDTEGYDSEIIKSIDFSKIEIDKIKYELWEFPEISYKRHGEKSKLYGLNGMNYIENLLKNIGYTITKDNTDVTAIKN